MPLDYDITVLKLRIDQDNVATRLLFQTELMRCFNENLAINIVAVTAAVRRNHIHNTSLSDRLSAVDIGSISSVSRSSDFNQGTPFDGKSDASVTSE